MQTILIEPTDVLFFRDAIPMSAGQGQGAGCRLPFPSTVHEAFRASLLRARGQSGLRKTIPGRPRAALRKGNWHADCQESDVQIASKAFRSLRTIGPLPCHPRQGLLLPVPLDVALTPDRQHLACRQLWHNGETPAGTPPEHDPVFRPPCLPVATTPPEKHSQLKGWWTVNQFQHYLRGELANPNHRFQPLSTAELWQPEHRVGVQIDPARFAAAEHQLYAGNYLRPQRGLSFAVQTHLSDPRNGELQELQQLSWLLLGGEFRLAHLHHSPDDPFAPLRQSPEPLSADGPCLLKWVLVTPAIFAHGSLPGWCAPPPGNPDGLPPGRVRLGTSRRKTSTTALPGRAHLVSWCLGKPCTVSGWDVADDRAKPTLLAVPEGSVYYFLCENHETAAALARKLHWQPRSDFYGEKGCGYGLVSFAAAMHPTSADVPALAQKLFNP